MIDFAEMEKLIGKVLPGGAARILPYEDWLMSDAVCAVPAANGAHPIWAYLAPMAGLGLTWGEFFAFAGAQADDGPMLGEIDIEIREPLQTDVPYRAEGEIIDVKRKSGRALGVFDLLTFRVDLLLGERRVATSTQSIIFPRRG
ncbi:hypothetical protein [Terrarubrum flagellatum]|uniref:hypothetical protein n=1 Tax=Terrirubrum flagellatum TaxID=2895980 RepID=UPI0031450970